MLRLFRERLFAAFFDWLDLHEEKIGRWYADLWNEGKKAEEDCDTAVKIMGTSMWMLNMVANLGVWAGVGPGNVNLQHLAEGLDRRATLRLLNMMASCMCLQYLPKEEATKPFAIISGKKFSLKLWVRTQSP